MVVDGDDNDGATVNSMDGVGDGGNTVEMNSCGMVSVLLGFVVADGLLFALLHQLRSNESYVLCDCSCGCCCSKTTDELIALSTDSNDKSKLSAYSSYMESFD